MTVLLPAVVHQASFVKLIDKVEINCFSSKSAGKDFIVVEGLMTKYRRLHQLRTTPVGAGQREKEIPRLYGQVNQR